MARVSPYHTTSPEYAPQIRDFFHDHDDCPEGKKIKRENRKSGAGGKRTCKECIKLG
jgi:Mn-dependent DtxR family transcriptional regulator